MGRADRALLGGKDEAMRSVKVVTLAATAMVITTAAMAADLPPIMPMQVKAPVVTEDFGGWYLRGDVGVGSQQFREFNHHQTNEAFVWPASWRIDQKDIKDTAFVGFGVGYQFNNFFRADVTGEYRMSSKGKAIGSYTEFCPGGRCFDVYDFDHQASVFLANVYADLGTWWCLTPFIGAGVGTARHQISAIHDVGFISDGTTGFGFATADKTTWTLAWAVHAGLAYSVSNNLKLEIGYRFLNMGTPETGIVNCNSAGCAGSGPKAFYSLTDFQSHDLKIGMRWLLNAPTVSEPVYQPLVRKG
jgi:opacity protein-like surface antigen